MNGTKSYFPAQAVHEKNSALVLEGETVKLRLLAERKETGNQVHVDWVRFTVLCKSAPALPVDLLFPKVSYSSIDWENRQAALVKSFRELSESDYFPTCQAYTLASDTAAALGSDFSVDQEVKKGMDFYKHRFSILLNGIECGWVGFLASSESPRQTTQGGTIHCNLYGTACTFASPGWRDRLADLIDTHKDAKLTRADLALDFFDGYEGGIQSVMNDYANDLCNVGGRRLKFSCMGDWVNGHDRSIYIGSRESGKITNIYEKGDQLFGEKTGSEWVRFELRYGNKLRVLSTDLLRRPDDFFASASDWHESVLRKSQSVFVRESVPCKPRLQIESVLAECTRNVRWLATTAAGSIAIAVELMDSDELWDLIGNAQLPGRLRKFSKDQLSKCYQAAKSRLSSPLLVKDEGTNATFSLAH